MINHPAVKTENIIHEIDKDGNRKTILLVTTDARFEPNSPLETSLADAIVDYLKTQPSIDIARIG
ncbi:MULTISPECIES: hypothetical protein [Sinorhizobium]|uniref:Uncharacterized protein n=1 Tax=Sinorhizobium medicae (strain WSM419) TaxID=366394 RepID=A6U923_SINMW|nr:MULTISPECIES: hypothetical protein [Sinorhizobium]ABR60153.1 hypothetical protein Smed_1303 [Sinorhizobium medicae WSM419]MQV62319.1 hypothetical protein [Sinorhizobium meliloti]